MPSIKVGPLQAGVNSVACVTWLTPARQLVEQGADGQAGGDAQQAGEHEGAGHD